MPYLSFVGIVSTTCMLEDGNDKYRSDILNLVGQVYGGNGDDHIFCGNAFNFVQGGPGDDLLVGGSHLDVLRGGDGNDLIFGNGGRDFLFGENGKDFIDGGFDGLEDIIEGGPDGDTFVVWVITDSKGVESYEDFLPADVSSEDQRLFMDAD